MSNNYNKILRQEFNESNSLDIKCTLPIDEFFPPPIKDNFRGSFKFLIIRIKYF